MRITLSRRYRNGGSISWIRDMCGVLERTTAQAQTRTWALPLVHYWAGPHSIIPLDSISRQRQVILLVCGLPFEFGRAIPRAILTHFLRPPVLVNQPVYRRVVLLL